ncbi:MAG: mannose-1-phosphate guanylyltransferase [candidate division WOR-3 bacterium]
MKRVAVILAGGKGERFWPKSKPDFPKQFLSFFDRRPAIKLTEQRLTGLVSASDRYYVVPQRLVKVVRKVFGLKNLIVEPVGRNTAAAIGLAALVLQKRLGDAIMFVLPSDHLIRDKERFQNCLRFAAGLAERDYLVTFGIKPSRPDTNYGYIKCGSLIEERDGMVAYRVLNFKEKPDPRTAVRYLRAGNYYWNSGIFVWRVKTIIEALREYAPDLYRGLTGYLRQRSIKVFENLPSISIDYQVMEKAKRIALIRANFDWDDIGSWDALARHLPRDEKGNVVVGSHIGIDTKDSIIFSEKRLIATIGVDDLIIIDGGDEVLVCKRDHISKIREVVQKVSKGD